MGQQFTVSDMGLKLIKAYEGYRPVDRVLVSGQRVVGYGHRLSDDRAASLTKDEAGALLREDLAPFEDMVNDNVHAPLTQSQFDALCSLAFNIGPKAFLSSDTLRALNNGRPLDAAHGFDIWRKSEIDGKVFVVDALVRRRTAEKALFLRPENHTLQASRVALPPIVDSQLQGLDTNDGLPVFTAAEADTIVAEAPYDSAPAPYGRRDGDNIGTFALSEIDMETDTTEAETSDVVTPDANTTEDGDSQLVPFNPPFTVVDDDLLLSDEELLAGPSPIAEAAAEVSDRLDALIATVGKDSNNQDDWPESLITPAIPELILPSDSNDKGNSETAAETSTGADILEFKARETEDLDEVDTETDVIDNIDADDAVRRGRDSLDQDDSASKFIAYDPYPEPMPNPPRSIGLYAFMMVTGMAIIGIVIAINLRGSELILGEYGPVTVMIGGLVGLMVVLGAFYYFLRNLLRKN